jgi:hypothetical protein
MLVEWLELMQVLTEFKERKPLLWGQFPVQFKGHSQE